MSSALSDSRYDNGHLPRHLHGYDVIDFLGEGAGSVIYAVTDPVSHQVFALKYVAVKNEKDNRFVEQLANEYEVSRHFGHSCLRRCLGLKYSRTLLRKVTDAALVMELFDGASLEGKPLTDFEKILNCFQQTAEALGAMHAHGYVHCDLKPNNILVAGNGDVKVIDLGQACPVGTVKKRIQGTPDFISPEQVHCEPVTVRTDVFNFGATLYWAVCGRNLPTLYNIKRTENSFLVDGAFPSPHEVNSRVPENLSNLVMDCVRTNPAKRPADMTELNRRLETIAHTLHKPAHPITGDAVKLGSPDDSFIAPAPGS